MALSLSTRISLLPRLNSSREIYSKVARISERTTTAQRLDPPRGGTLSTSKRILARVSCCTSPSSSMAPVTCSRYLTLETRHRVLETGHGSCWTRVCWKQPVKTEECRSVGLIPSSQISHSCIYIYISSRVSTLTLHRVHFSPLELSWKSFCPALSAKTLSTKV